MLKKIVLVLVILAPSALYLYIVNREPAQPKPSTQPEPHKQQPLKSNIKPLIIKILQPRSNLCMVIYYF